MEKLILVASLLLFVGFSSGTNVPYDGMTLEYNYSIHETGQENSEESNVTGEFSLYVSESEDGWDMDFTENPIISDYEVKEDNTTNFWVKELGSGREKHNINGSTLNEVSSYFNPSIEGLGDLKAFKLVRESLEVQGSTRQCDVSKLPFWINMQRFYDDDSGILLKTELITENCDVITYEISQNDVDTDSDGLNDLKELVQYGTDPTRKDTDGDGLNDEKEIDQHGSDPSRKDTDGDGLNDSKEVNIGTDPDDPDTDGDSLEDGREVKLGSSPKKIDTDSDTVPDYREIEIGTDLTKKDSDNDFLPDSKDPMPTNPLLPYGPAALAILAVIVGLSYKRN